MTLLGALSLGVLIAAYAGLAAVGALSWRQTQPFRGTGVRTIGPMGPRPPPPSGRAAPTSPTTYLAGVAGLVLIALGIAVAGTGHVWETVAMATAGAFVAVAGFRSRVAGIGTDTEGLMIRYAHRPELIVPWRELVRLRGPRTPLGGWRLEGTAGAATLMPSDLLGHEWLLAVAVERAQLSLVGRRDWRRKTAPLR